MFMHIFEGQTVIWHKNGPLQKRWKFVKVFREPKRQKIICLINKFEAHFPTFAILQEERDIYMMYQIDKYSNLDDMSEC